MRAIPMFFLLILLSAGFPLRSAEQYLSRREAMRAAGDFKARKQFIEAERAYNEAARLSRTNNDRKSAWESARDMRARARELQNEFNKRVEELNHQHRIRGNSEIVDRCFYELFRDESFPVTMRFQAYRNYSGMLSRDGDTARLKGDYKLWKALAEKRTDLAGEAAELPDLPLRLRDEALAARMSCANNSGNHEVTIEAARYLLEHGNSRNLRESAAAHLVHGYTGIEDYPNAIRAGEIFLRESTGSAKQKNGIRVKIGDACLRLKRYQDAVRTFRPVAFSEEEPGSNNWEIRAAKRGLVTAYIGLKDDYQIRKICEKLLEDNFDENLNNFLQQELFKVALRAGGEKRVREAYERYRKESHSADAKVTGILLYAEFHQKQKQPDQALLLLREAWETPGSSAGRKEAVLRQAAGIHQQMKNTKKYRKCQQKLAEILQRSDPFDQAMQRAYAASAAGNADLALKLGRKALEAAQNDGRRRTARLFCAQKQMDRREYQAALESFSGIGSIGDLPAEQQIRIANQQAVCHFRTGNPDRAELIFRKILNFAQKGSAANAYLPDIFSNLRTILVQKKKAGEIPELLEPFTSDPYPGSVRRAAHLQMAQIYRSNLQDLTKAEEHAEEILKITPLSATDRFRAELELARCLQAAKKPQEADSVLQKALNRSGLSPEVRSWGWKARLDLCRAGKGNSEELYEDILKDSGLDEARKAEFRIQLAEFLLGEKRYDEARKEIARCKQLVPSAGKMQDRIRGLEQKLTGK